MWVKCWQEASIGAVGPVHILPIAIMMLPATKAAQLEADVTIEVLIKVVRSVKEFIDLSPGNRGNTRDGGGRGSSSRAPDWRTISPLEAVMDVIRDRLPNTVGSVAHPGALALSVGQLLNEYQSTVILALPRFDLCRKIR